MSVREPSIARAADPVIQRFFDVSLYLLLFSGFATLAGTGKLDLFSLLLGVCAFLVRGYLLLQRVDATISEKWTSYITLLYTAFFALDYFAISQAFLPALVHIVLLLVVLKIFSVHRERDYVYLAMLAFGMVLAAAILTVDSLFFMIFCVFVLLAVMTFVSMEMRRSWIQAKWAGESEERRMRDLRRLPISLWRACIVLVVSIVVGTGTLFFALPRKPSSGYLGGFAARSELSTGFSEQVRLGDIGRIQQSDEVVMHVKFSPGTRVPNDLRWRGIALTFFDGRDWTGPLADGPIESASGGTFSAALFSTRLFTGYGRRVSYRVSLEPFGAHVFFVLPQALYINGRYQSIRIDSTGTIFNMDPSRAVTDYAVVSEVPPPMPANVTSSNVSGVSEIMYLEEPLHLDPRITELASRITENESTAFMKASAIERYLSSHYGYTLQLPQFPQKDPVADFLFVRKRGHCEYFASAMVLMLRTLRIPSRLVNGFRGGEFNDVTGSYIVRAKDAHSWVEAYFPGYGWYTFDPTPATPELRGPWTRLDLYADAAREFWHDWVINYDTGHQTTLGFVLLRQSRAGLEDTTHGFASAYRACERWAIVARRKFQQHAGTWTLWVSIGFLGVMLLLAGPKLFTTFRNLRLARSPRLEPHSAATIWYGRALRLLAKRGMRKAPAQTPQEFVQTVKPAPLRRQLTTFTEHYERARFGDSAGDAEKLPEMYRELELVAKE